MLIFFSISAFIVTFLGGMFALRFKDKLHLILGFSAGAILGIAFFDLIPETIELGAKYYDVNFVMFVAALGFAVYMIFDRFIFTHSHEIAEDHCCNKRGLLGAGSLAVHSFIDGAAIGLAFQISINTGIIVAGAIMVHKFFDGLNTVNMIVKNSGTREQAFKWLFINSITPVLGIASASFLYLPEKSLGIILALFAGFFLYIGASDLLPESHHNHPTAWTTISTILGILVLYFVVKFAGI